MTRIGKRKLRVPRDRNGGFSTALLERSQRSEKALVGGHWLKMYVPRGARSIVGRRCIVLGHVAEVVAEPPKTRASNHVPPTQSVPCEDVFA